MENATKALLIAGAVLVAIVLIAVGIKILSSTQGVTEQVDNVSSAMEVSTFNSQFTKYTGTQSAVEVKSLLSQVIATYRSGSKHKITIATEAGKGLSTATYYSADSIATIMSKLQQNSKYTVSILSYDSNGYINYIEIK